MITGCIDHGKADRQNFPDFILTRMRARDSPREKDSYTLISDIRAYLPKSPIYQRQLNMEPPDMGRDNAFSALTCRQAQSRRKDRSCSAIFMKARNYTMMDYEYGDNLMVYCFGSVSREDTIDRLSSAIASVAHPDIRRQMFVLKEKISEKVDDEEWAELFPQVQRNMAVLLYNDRMNFMKAMQEAKNRMTRGDAHD